MLTDVQLVVGGALIVCCILGAAYFLRSVDWSRRSAIRIANVYAALVCTWVAALALQHEAYFQHFIDDAVRRIGAGGAETIVERERSPVWLTRSAGVRTPHGVPWPHQRSEGMATTTAEILGRLTGSSAVAAAFVLLFAAPIAWATRKKGDRSAASKSSPHSSALRREAHSGDGL